MTLNSYGPVPVSGQSVQATARYTTVDAVKAKLQIATADWDADILEVVIATEATMDLLMGRSLPDVIEDPAPDPLPEMPLYDHVPWQIKRWALDASTSMFRRTDYINAAAGSDLFAGVDVAAEIQQTVRNHPYAFDFQVAWGIG